MKMQKVSFGDFNIVIDHNQNTKKQLYAYEAVTSSLNKVEDSSLIKNNSDYTTYDCENCDGFNLASTSKTEEELFAKL